MATEANYDVGVRLKGDGSGLVGATTAGIEAQRQLEEQVKRTSAALKSEADEHTRTRQQLDAYRNALEGLTGSRERDLLLSNTRTRQLRDEGRELEGVTAKTLAAGAAVSGARGFISGAIGALGGPVGLIAMLATGALGWTAFGNAATEAASAAEDAAKRARAALANLPGDRPSGEYISAEIVDRQRQLRAIDELEERMGGPGSLGPADAVRRLMLQTELRGLSDVAIRLSRPEPAEPAAPDGTDPHFYEDMLRALREEEKQQKERQRERLAQQRAELKSIQEGLLGQERAIQAREDEMRAEHYRRLKERREAEAETRTLLAEDARNWTRHAEQIDDEGYKYVYIGGVRVDRTRWEADQREAGERMQREFERTADNINRVLADSLMRGFEIGGKDGAQVLVDTLEAAMKTAVFQPLIAPIVQPIGQGFAGIGQGIANFLYGAPAGGGANGSAAASSLAFLGPAAATAIFLYSMQTSGEGQRLMNSSAMRSTLPGNAFRNTIVGRYLGSGGPHDRSAFLGGGLGGFDMGETSFFGPTANAQTREFIDYINAREQNLVRNLGLTEAERARVNAALGPGRSYGMGSTDSTPMQSGQFELIEAERLQAAADALGRSIEELTEIMSLSAEQWEAAKRSVEQQLAALARGLPDFLGITGLQRYQESLSTSQYMAPLERLSAARSIYEDRLARARGGDLDAVRELPAVSQAMLAIGRDVWASGATFQEMLQENRNAIAEVLGDQQALQLDILREVPASVMQLDVNNVAAIREQTDRLVEELKRLDRTLRDQAA